jgi:hypothetical protein
VCRLERIRGLGGRIWLLAYIGSPASLSKFPSLIFCRKLTSICFSSLQGWLEEVVKCWDWALYVDYEDQKAEDLLLSGSEPQNVLDWASSLGCGLCGQTVRLMLPGIKGCLGKAWEDVDGGAWEW